MTVTVFGQILKITILHTILRNLVVFRLLGITLNDDHIEMLFSTCNVK